MKKDKKTSVTKKEVARKCVYPGCSRTPNSYNNGIFCYQHENIKSAEEAVKYLLKDNQDKKNAGFDPYKTYYRSVSKHVTFQSKPKPPYEIVKKDGKRFIVENGKESKQAFWIDKEPDLFIRFIELPETEQAYLDFVSKYGLFNLWEYIDKKHNYSFSVSFGNILGDSQYFTFEKKTDEPTKVIPMWGLSEEPIFVIKEFHQELINLFHFIRNYIETGSAGRDSKYLNEDMITSYFLQRNFASHNLQYMPNFSEFHQKPLSPYLYRLIPTTLAGAIFLQLYRFLLVGKKLNRCALPQCGILTTRPKFCSTQHGNLFRAWKNRGNLIEVDGKIQTVKKKRGRPKAKND